MVMSSWISPPGLRPTRRLTLLLAAASVAVAACGTDPGVITLTAATPNPVGSDDATSTTTPSSTEPAPPTTEAPPPTTPPPTEPELAIEVAFGDVIDADDNKPTRDHDEFVAVAFVDIERWWGEVYPEVYGTPFEPLEGGIFAGYPQRTTDIPGCGEPSTSYDDLTQFVAFYCEFGDFMAYDDGDGDFSLLTPLADEFGPAVMGVVLAHEYGHAIQRGPARHTEANHL
jgi:hypothetical protein